MTEVMKDINVAAAYRYFGELLNICIWEFSLEVNGLFQLPYVATRTSVLHDLRLLSHPEGRLLVTSIKVAGFEELCEPVCLMYFGREFPLPKTRSAEPGETIVIEIKRL
jgi:hypothetical protein